MALKFLNKKGWHTGSLRNIENVWKAEQKHESEQKKLEELRKQIQDEREQSEFRQLQEQAGLVPKQERLEFLYDSGLAVGRSNSDNFPLGKPVEPQNNETENELSKLAAVPGALFVAEKPPSANDVWRKLHTDPLLMIRQREQEALAQIKNNPVKMEIIKKSVERQKVNKEDKRKRKAEKKKHDKEKRKREQASSDSDSDIDTDNKGKKKHHKEKKPRKSTSSDFENSPEREHLKDSEKQPARRYGGIPIDSRMHRSSCHDRQRQRSRSPSKNRERHIAPLHNGQTYKSQSPSDYGRMHRSISPLGRGRQRSPSPVRKRQRSPSPVRKRQRSPSPDRRRRRSPSPDRQRQRSPSQTYKSQSHSDYGRMHRSISPLGRGRQRPPSPVRQRQRSPSPVRKRQRSPSPDRRRHRSPSPDRQRQRSPSPDRRRHRSTSPDRRRQRSPSPDRRRRRSPSPDRRRPRSPSNYDERQRTKCGSGYAPSMSRSVDVCLKDGKKNEAHEASNKSNGRDTNSRLNVENAFVDPNISSKPVQRTKYQAGKLSEEEKADRLREMQIDAEIHEEQRWQRLKKASDADAREAKEATKGTGKSFLDSTNRSVYGAEKGGSSTIEESIRRRTHYLQGSAVAGEGNAFRR